MSIRLLTVDAAGTLVRPWPSVGAVYGRTAREHGIEVSDEEVNTEFYKTLADYRPVNKQMKEKKANFGAKWLPKPFALLPGIKTSILCSKNCGTFLPRENVGSWQKRQNQH